MSDWKRAVKLGLLQTSRVRWLQDMLVRRNQGRARILMYHRVTTELGPTDAPYNAVAPAVFEAQLAWLARHCQVISLDRLVAALRQQQPLPDRAVVITFDDGFRDNYLNAFPLLRKYQLPATIYACAATIGTTRRLWFDQVSALINATRLKSFRFPAPAGPVFDLTVDRMSIHYQTHQLLKRLSPQARDAKIEELAEALQVDLGIVESAEGPAMLSWAEVEEMAAANITIGAHTMTHPILAHLDDATLAYEIVESQRVLESRLQRPVRHFSYPNGTRDDYDGRCLQLIAAHFDSATTTLPGLADGRCDLYQLPRIHVDDEVPFFPVKLELPQLSRSSGSEVKINFGMGVVSPA